jgi:asparagine synthase (glutamine-hydrolysing)
MATPDGAYTIVFNGEIFNHQELRHELASLGWTFNSHSDTEVLLAAWSTWGNKCLVRLDGMFAFAVYERAANTVTLVRDAFGIKPLYYSYDGQSFAFASDSRTLASMHRNRPDRNWQRLYEYLTFGRYEWGSSTFWQGVDRVEPGSSITFDFSGNAVEVRRERWWNCPTEERPMDFDDAAAELRSRFLQGIGNHLSSEVSWAVTLSGGLDSAAIACSIREVEPDADITAFSYSIGDGSRADESRWIEMVAQAARVRLVKLSIGPDELGRDLDDMILAQGEPFGSTSIYAQYRLFRLIADQGYKVAVGGQGADEVLAGYHGYPGWRIQSLVERGDFVGAWRFYRNWRKWPGRSPRSVLEGLGSAIAPVRVTRSAAAIAGLGPHPPWIDQDACRQMSLVTALPVRPSSVMSQRGRRLAGRQALALFGGDLEAHLRQEDRNAMRWSVENRVPFLRPSLAQFALSLPERYLVSDQGETKHLFRHAMRGIVPPEVLARRDKVGFETPEIVWLRHLQENDSLPLDGLSAIPFLRREPAQTVVHEALHGRRPFNWQVWRLVNASRWIELTA